MSGCVSGDSNSGDYYRVLCNLLDQSALDYASIECTSSCKPGSVPLPPMAKSNMLWCGMLGLGSCKWA